MGDEFELGSGNWWDNTRNRSFDSGTTPASISTTLNTLASFGSWPPEAAPPPPPPDVNKSVGDQSTSDQSLQMMGFGWNQALLGEKVETSSFRSLLQEEFHEPKLYSGPSSEDSSLNRSGFSLDQTAAFSSQASSNDSTITSGAGFQVDFHGMMLSENQQSLYNQNRSSSSSANYQYSQSSGSGGYGSEYMNKYPQFLRTPPPPPVVADGSSSHLHFTNNTPFWNASGPPQADAGSGFFPAQQIPRPPSFHHNKSKSTGSELRDISATSKKNSPETTNKRARGNEASATPPPAMPAFKVRKEKMGDRITALQQLVSPFGKTDTASVLSEAIAYIKFLHEQVSVLSNPYLKNGAPTQHHHQSIEDKSNEAEGARQDLRSRGLCLVPVSSTFPMTHETTVDFWTPTYGGTFR